MARIAGITIEKDKQGNARYARIDLKKYGHLLNPIFKELGIEWTKYPLTILNL